MLEKETNWYHGCGIFESPNWNVEMLLLFSLWLAAGTCYAQNRISFFFNSIYPWHIQHTYTNTCCYISKSAVEFFLHSFFCWVEETHLNVLMNLCVSRGKLILGNFKLKFWKEFCYKNSLESFAIKIFKSIGIIKKKLP